VDKILSRLPPDHTVGQAKELFSQQLTEELKRNRYGDPQKAKRAKKANRLPAGVSYTVTATQEVVVESSAGTGKYRTLYSTVPNIDIRKILFVYTPVAK
jgi:hypothetical protein